METPHDYTTGFVTSKDGTHISYRQIGAGPAVILVHGGMSAAQNLMDLARALSHQFTVYVPNRRGRGGSGPFGLQHGLQTESEDLQALINETKADKIFGLSVGAICTLQAALITPSVKKVVLYEPPVKVNDSWPGSWGNPYEAALAKGNIGKAFFAVMKGTDDPSFFTALPAWGIGPLLNLVLKASNKKATGEDVPLKNLVPTLHYDLITIRESVGLIEKAKSIHSEILLMGGTKSQPYLKQVLNDLATALPQAKRITLQGLGHIAADNHGDPQRVAKELITFFNS